MDSKKIPPAPTPPTPSQKLSLVVPVYNEQDVLEKFFATVEPILQSTGMDFEVVCVNDGSKDNTLTILLKMQLQKQYIKIIDLSRNFGKERALIAGMDNASGDVIIPLDVDLQDPPEAILKLVEKWREGFQVVFTVRPNRHNDSLLKRKTSALFYKSYNKIAVVPIQQDVSDFCLIDRIALDSVLQLRERSRFTKGIIAWVGYKTTVIELERAPRLAGESKWSLWKLWNFALDGITGFSTVPLRFWSYVGGAVSLIAFLYGIVILINTLIHGRDVPGYASLMLVILFLGGIQLLSLGILGEYLGRVYTEVKGRPLYIVQQVYSPKKTEENP
jgi:glycosyltransferase involved in cell wall biosynthesis